MKKFAIGVLVIIMALATSVSAMDMTGIFSGGVFFDYGVGFGKAFDDANFDYGEYSVKTTSKLTWSIGAMIRYNINNQMGILATVDRQAWKYEATATIAGYSGSGSTTENWICIAADFAYYLMPGEKTQPYFAAGPGIYIFSGEGQDSKFGVNGTIGVLHFVGDKIAIDVRGRFHYIPNAFKSYDVNTFETKDEAITAAQGHIGVSYFFFPTTR